MTIKREDLDRRKVDCSDVTYGRRLPPVHPGEILRQEILTPTELIVNRLVRVTFNLKPGLAVNDA